MPGLHGSFQCKPARSRRSNKTVRQVQMAGWSSEYTTPFLHKEVAGLDLYLSLFLVSFFC